MSRDETNRRLPWLPTALVVLLPLLYVLSYAPVYRLGKPSGWSQIDRPHAFYAPVDWLIDNTPLNEPLYRWAAVWGVRGDFVWAAAFRAFDRGEAGEIGVSISPEAETPHLFEHVDTSRQ